MLPPNEAFGKAEQKTDPRLGIMSFIFSKVIPTIVRATKRRFGNEEQKTFRQKRQPGCVVNILSKCSKWRLSKKRGLVADGCFVVIDGPCHFSTEGESATFWPLFQLQWNEISLIVAFQIAVLERRGWLLFYGRMITSRDHLTRPPHATISAGIAGWQR